MSASKARRFQEAHDRDGSSLVDAALRCYPARWRRRHADEAAELAALLIRDGTPAAAIAWSYLLGAARGWLTPRPGRSLSTMAAALLAAACLVGFSAALIAETAPAKAAGTTQSPQTKPTSPSTGARSPHRVTACRSVPSGRPTAAAPAVGHSQLSVQGTAHDHSC
jgi:hypothetical protein